MLSIIAVTHNSIKYLPDFMESLFAQSYFKQFSQPPDIFIVDNASTDGSVKFIKDHYPTVHLLRNVKNVGLPRAWNQAIRTTRGEYVLITNPDIILDKYFIQRAMEYMEADKNIGSLGGKLYQLEIKSFDDENSLASLEKTNVLDSCGLQASKGRRFIERGGGEVDKGQYNQAEEVFGISGACVFYRRQALEQVKFNQEYFDEDFFLYKEDIDMAWRLRLAGWSAFYLPSAVAYHHRRARSFASAGWQQILKYHRSKENFVNFYSYRNHGFLLYKNLLWQNFMRHLPFIFFYELKKFIYVLLLDNSTLRRSLRDWFKLFRRMRNKRRVNMRLRRIQPEEIRQWFN